MKMFHLFLRDLRKRENLEIYATVSIALIVSVLGILGIVKIEIVSSAVLATLALVSFSLLTNRRIYEEILLLLQRKLKGENSPLLWQSHSREVFELKKLVDEAKSIDLLGYTQLGMLRDFKSSLIRALTNGARIRILIINPEGSAAKLMRHALPDASKIDLSTQLALNYIAEIRETLGMTKGQLKGSFEIKLIDWIPSCNMIIVNDHYETGIMSVRLNTISLNPKLPFQEKLYLILTRSENDQEFTYFLSQFEDLWQDKISRSI
jgi:hypothetical protein